MIAMLANCYFMRSIIDCGARLYGVFMVAVSANRQFLRVLFMYVAACVW